MLLNNWLRQATHKLEQVGLDTARLDCLVLLEDATGKDRSYLLAHPDFVFQGATLKTVDEWVERRAKHEPLAYIRGKSEFYGREFLVNARTLEPRSETETMVALATKVIGYRLEVREKTIIADVGTGSGCVAITAKLEMPELVVLAIDISKECVKIAEQNAHKLGADVKFYQGNLLEPYYNLEPITSNLFAILANLPYVPDNHTINQAAMFEPKLAIFGGPDGLDLYRKLFVQIADLPAKPMFIFTESLPFQHKELAQIAKSAGYKLKTSEDFIQVYEQGSR